MSPTLLEEFPLSVLLRDHAIPVLRRVSVEESPDTVVLSGTLPSFYLKQVAQEVILPHLAGRTLVNRIEVPITGRASAAPTAR